VRLQKEVGITSIYVTHDQAEALVMSDRIVVMDKAVIQQIGDPQTIYAEPANTFVAGFIGVANLLEGRLVSVDGATCDVEVAGRDGGEPLRIRARTNERIAVGEPAYLNIRPEDLSLRADGPPTNGEANVLPGAVIDTVYLGNFLECRVDVRGHEIGIQIDHFEQLAPGQAVHLTVEPAHVQCLAD
jgi:ABC-type Fe3+/spermidine/putrescine transport system ATPase subunit